MTQVDLIIIGAGCAGLGLAKALADKQYTGSVVILESNSTFNNDKTWCFYATPDHPWYQHARYHWSEAQFSDTKNNITAHYYQNNTRATNNQNVYCCLPSQHYYQVCLNALASTDIQLLLDTKVTDCIEQPTQVQVKTNNGSFCSQWVIDTRPPAHAPNAILYQGFYGQEVILKKPLKQPQQVRLMSGLQTSPLGMEFYYLLPFTETHVLIEPTGFHYNATNTKAMEKHIQGICDKEGVEIKHILRTESAVLPMGMNPLSSTARLVRAGTSAGALRAATGYGFLRIQQWAELCSDALVTGKAPIPQPPAGKLEKMMDTLFLQVVKHQPTRAPDIFMQLASALNPDIFVRLMSNKSTWLDWLKIIMALPKRPFLKTLLLKKTQLNSVGP